MGVGTGAPYFAANCGNCLVSSKQSYKSVSPMQLGNYF